MKENGKSFWKGFILYNVIMVVVSFLATLIQFIARRFAGTYSSFIFSGNNYKYNPFFYVLGVVIFFGTMTFLYKKMVRGRIAAVINGSILKLFCVALISLVVSLIMIVVNTLGTFLVCGMSSNIIPEWLWWITNFGWGIINFVVVIVNIILVIGKNK